MQEKPTLCCNFQHERKQFIYKYETKLFITKMSNHCIQSAMKPLFNVLLISKIIKYGIRLLYACMVTIILLILHLIYI